MIGLMTQPKKKAEAVNKKFPSRPFKEDVVSKNKLQNPNPHV